MTKLPTIPKGTRDYSPEIMAKRNYIFETVKSVFVKYGYMPIETPAMENLSTLMGKYGDEGDKLLFKILNSGDFLSSLSDSELNRRNIPELTRQIAEKGLRYDLTVPFARFVVQHRNEICLPFKRYQIQPVWRADKPQKGRYREFFQCDIDVVGSDSLIYETELIQIVEEVYKKLDIRTELLINNRKILAGIAEIIGYPEKITDITVAIDKMDKIGPDNVNAELRTKGISEAAIEKLQPIILLKGGNRDKLDTLSEILAGSETGMKGIRELTSVFDYLDVLKPEITIKLDLTLARGLSYYTGAIFEVKALDVAIGSITGGGRYDNLTGIFGLENMSGVGISFGADRIYDVMETLGLFPADSKTSTRILFLNFGKKEEICSLKLIKEIRNAGINTEIYPEPAKIKKQMNYADKKGILYVAIVGENEMENGKVTVKHMSSGDQIEISREFLCEYLKNNIL